MARPADYYEKRLTAPTPAPAPKQAAPTQARPASPVPAPTGPEPSYLSTGDEFAAGGEGTRAITRPDTFKYLPYQFTKAVLSGNEYNKMPGPEVWNNLSTDEQRAIVMKGGAEVGLNVIKSVPTEIAKAPMRLALSSFDFLGRAMTTAGLATPEGLKYMGAEERYNMPLLGEVASYGATYNDLKETGMDPIFAGLQTAYQAAGDVAVGISAVEGVAALAKPRISKMTPGVMGPDFRPLQARQIQEMSSAMKQVNRQLTGTELTAAKSPVFSAQQNPNNIAIKLSKDVAARYKGSPDNTFLLGVPKGGMIEYSVVQVKSSPIKGAMDALKAKFGKNRVVATEHGPGVVVDRISLPAAAARPASESGALVSRETPPVTSIRAKKGAKTAQFELDTPATVPGTGVEVVKDQMTPSVMRAPLKGFEDAPVSGGQVKQLKMLQADRNFDDDALAAMSRVITGKENVNTLSQAEAFQVSETMRLHAPGAEMPIIEDAMVGFSSYAQPTRYWMESVERNMGVPLMSQMYYPMTTAIRLGRNFRTGWQTASREVMGKYAGNKFLQERRLLMSYVEGNKDVIAKNAALSAEAKAELTTVGDWFKDRFREFHEAQGIESKRFVGEYAPNLRKLDSVFQLYKTNELPAEIKPFFQFEREGMLAPIEDDILAVFDIYTGAMAKDKFLKGPLEEATKTLSNPNIPRRTYNAANDWLQETMGFQGATEEFLNTMGKRISKYSKGAIPENIFNQMIDLGMTNSYSGALGIPRVMPIVRNTAQQLMNYAEFGPEVFARGVKWASDPKNQQLMRDKGFIVEMGVPYGEELAQQAGRGPLGKSVDAYKRLGQATMKPYASIDAGNRYVAYGGVKVRFEDAWAKFRDGKINYGQLEEAIDMDGFSPTLQKILRGKFSANTAESLDEAVDLMARDTIDRTQFPYRKGEQSRAFFGLKGKLGLQFGQWTFEYLHTLSRAWAGRGQWDKLIRLFGTGEILKRSAEDIGGVNISSWVNEGPVTGIPVGPVAKTAASAISMFNAMFANMEDEVDRNASDIIRSIQIFGGPAFGVGKQKLEDFNQSIKRYEAGVAQAPDPEKPFGIWSNQGKLIRWVSFADLMKVTLGFQEPEGDKFGTRIDAITSEDQKYKNKIDQAMNYLIDGKFEKFDQTVTDNQLLIPDIGAKMKSYTQPLDQRIYDRMPLQLKAKYFDAFFTQ